MQRCNLLTPCVRSTPAPNDGLISVWMDSAIKRFRQPFDEVIESSADRMAAYLVTESQPIRNTRFPAEPGQRTAGFSQLAFLRRPPPAHS